MNLARLNHILIPKTHDKRERLRAGKAGRLIRPARWLFHALSDEGRMLALLSLFVGAAGLETEKTQIYVLWSLVAGLLVAALVVRRWYRMDGVSIEVMAPPRVSVGERVCFSLMVRNGGDTAHRTVRIHGPFLTWDGAWDGPLPGVKVIHPGKEVRCEAWARFQERGEHYLDPFEAAALVPMGLSMGPLIQTGGCRFRVIPRLAPVDHVELPIGARYQPGGVAQASRTGEAMEILGVRPYRAGDSVRDLHMRTWARVGVPHVKEYQQEYFTQIGVILDTDGTASASERSFEASVSLAAGVVSHLSGGEALIDVLVAGDHVHAMTLGRSLGFFEQALDVLASVGEGPEVDVEGLLAKLGPYLSRLSCVVLICESNDAKRQMLVQRIDGSGVACRALQVVESRGGVGGVFEEVTVAEIEGEVPLRLLR